MWDWAAISSTTVAEPGACLIAACLLTMRPLFVYLRNYYVKRFKERVLRRKEKGDEGSSEAGSSWPTGIHVHHSWSVVHEYQHIQP